VDLYLDVCQATNALDIDFLVVGAMARDLVLAHGCGSKIERGTRDVDFGINVANWDEFDALKLRLIDQKFEPDEKRAHRLWRKDSTNLPWEIDILPFGGIADSENTIHWPPGQEFSMNILGFAEALEHALRVQICDKPKTIIPVASPAGVCLLKLISWLDREVELRRKDASDIYYLIQNYSKIPEIYEALYQESYMEVHDWDETQASAMKLGKDVTSIGSVETIEFLKTELIKQPERVEQFVRDMMGQAPGGFDYCVEIFNAFAKPFRGQLA